MDAKKTGELIAQLRRERKLNQSELAERLGVTNKAISRWETGRGYPDIETLPKISEVLNVSIPELLSGQREPVTEPEVPFRKDPAELDRSIEMVCQYAGEQARKQKKKVTLQGALFSAVLLLCIVVILGIEAAPGVLDFFSSAEDFYWSVVGSEDCVIAADRNSLTYLGKTYLPLPMNGYQAVKGEIMVEECRIEGYGFLAKLPFGETLYEVENIPNQEVVYWQTEYDDCISRYFVLESEYDRYSQMVEDAVFETYYAVYDNESGYKWDRKIEEDLGAAIRNAEKGTAAEEPENCTAGVMVCCFDETHCFFYYAGRLIKAEDGYYWEPAIHSFTVTGGWNWTDRYYPITGFDDKLSRIFTN